MFVEHGPEVGSSFGDVPLTNHFEAEPEVSRPIRFFGRLKIDRQIPRPRGSQAFADGSAAPTLALMLWTYGGIVKVPIVDAFGAMRFHCIRDRQPAT